MNSDYDYLFKVVVAGNSGVGKTSLLNRYVEGFVPTGHFTTIGVDFKIKNVTVYIDGNPKIVKLQLWDTAGQERFQSISSSYFRGSSGIILVFALNDLNSFNKLNTWIDMAEEHNITNRIIIGNKADLTEERIVSQEVISITLKDQATYLEASAKTGENVNELFSQLATTLTQAAMLSNDKVRQEPMMELKKTEVEKRTGNRCCGSTG